MSELLLWEFYFSQKPPQPHLHPLPLSLSFFAAYRHCLIPDVPLCQLSWAFPLLHTPTYHPVQQARHPIQDQLTLEESRSLHIKTKNIQLFLLYFERLQLFSFPDPLFGEMWTEMKITWWWHQLELFLVAFPVMHDKSQMGSYMGKILQTYFLHLTGKTKHDPLSSVYEYRKQPHFSFQTNKYKMTH